MSVQDMCMVCAGRTVGLEIVLDTPDGTTRRRGSSGSSFWSVEIKLILTQDRCAACIERTIGSYIVLDTPDGTPR